LEAKIVQLGPKSKKFPVFSRLSGNLIVETGSMLSASATTQSHANQDFRRFVKWPPLGGMCREHFVSAKVEFDYEAVSALYSLASESRFPETATEP
jgi:hypothetical protein